MDRRSLVLVSATLAAALAILVVVGLRVLERDRDALFARYGSERQRAAQEAARGLTGDIAEVGEDLALASALLRETISTQLAERQLHAIASIKREYLAMYARADDGAMIEVTALDAPAGVAALARRALQELVDTAARRPGSLHVSRAFAESDPARWYRVFARRPKDQGPAVAVVVDMSVLLGRMRLPSDATTRLIVLDAHGMPARLSDPGLARLAGERHPDLRRVLQAVASGSSTMATLDGELPRKIGLPVTSAVVVAVPLTVDDSGSWTLLVIASAQALQTQEQTIVRRVVVGSVLVLVLLLSAAAYVLQNAFRARTLRERIKHTEHLAHLNEKAEKILDHIPSGVLALSDALTVTGANRWLSLRIGEEVTGKQLDQSFGSARAEDVALVVELVKRAQQTGQPQSLHCEHISLVGQDASLNIHAVPLARGAEDVSVLLVFDDLTELRRIEQRLLHSEKLVTTGQLAAGIAHEIGTPLNVARGRVELALSHLGAQHAEADNHRIVIDQIDRVTRLIQQLLDYVRPAPTTMQPVDLARTLHAVADLLAAQATKRGVALRVETASGPLTLRADPDQVQQVVVNLVLNAIDACSSGGTVVLRARPGASTIDLEIVDDGPGIPRKIQKQVFDPFFTTKKRGQGTGLGLWVVAQLLRAQSGEIELDSTPGRGTRVRVSWPVNT